MARNIINTQRLMQIVINPFHDSVNHLSGYIHIFLLNHSGG